MPINQPGQPPQTPIPPPRMKPPSIEGKMPRGGVKSPARGIQTWDGLPKRLKSDIQTRETATADKKTWSITFLLKVNWSMITRGSDTLALSSAIPKQRPIRMAIITTTTGENFFLSSLMLWARKGQLGESLIGTIADLSWISDISKVAAWKLFSDF